MHSKRNNWIIVGQKRNSLKRKEPKKNSLTIRSATDAGILTLSIYILLCSFSAQAAETKAPAKAAPVQAHPAPALTPTQAEKVDVETLKRRYWAKGEESEMQVVQNRLYSKAGRFELGAFFGFVSADPFLSVRGVGGTVGYHFTESWGLNLLAVSYMAEESSANKDFQKQTGGSAFPDTNEPKTFYGTELVYSPIYGKLSLAGKSIIYYDFHVMGGGGFLKSESGNDLTLHLGLGQQFYLSKSFALKIDYRIMRNNEVLIKKSPATRGQRSISRENYSNLFSVGVSLLL